MASLVINHNTQALNTMRNLAVTDKRLKTSLEHLSSGEKIVRAADGPATLMISEQMRAQVASVGQAIRNSETAVSMVQTTEAALDEVNKLLVSIRQLAVHAGNEGANDDNMLAADQLEVANALVSIDRISQFATFGKKKILDGSRGVNGVAAGAGLEFISASEVTQASPDNGYGINITQTATRSSVTGETPLTKEAIGREVTLKLQEGGRVTEYTTKEGDDIDSVIRQLQRNVDKFGLQLDVAKTEDDRLVVTHREYGSKNKFVVVSTEAGILSKQEGVLEGVQNGTDVAGTIGGQLAVGDGQLLKAGEGARAEGLIVRYTGEVPEDPMIPVGAINVTQNSPIFQIGANVGQKVSVSLTNVSTRALGNNIPNESGFVSLSAVDVRNPQGAEDTMRIVDKAIDDVNRVRAQLGAVQKNSLESNIRSLRVSQEELTAAESVLRDADMAQEISELTRNQIMMQSGIAMLGQANQMPRNVLSLLQGI
jgi:flagellin